MKNVLICAMQRVMVMVHSASWMGGGVCCQQPVMMGKFCAGAGQGVLNDIWTPAIRAHFRDISGDDLHLGFLESKMFGQAKFGAI